MVLRARSVVHLLLELEGVIVLMRMATSNKSLLLITLLFCAGPLTAQTIVLRSHFPMDVGHAWESSLGRTTITEVSVVQGTPTFAFSGSDGKVWQTNDTLGWRQHGVETTTGAVEFIGPMLLATAIAEVGDVFQSTGSALVNGLVPLSYESSSTLEAVERITSVLGTFEAARFSVSFRIFGTASGNPVDEQFLQTWWLADDVGPIRLQDSDGAAEDIFATNVVVPPPPDNVQLLSSVLPSSRSARVPTSVSVFATMLNAGADLAVNCGIGPASAFAGDLSYRPTDPVSNAPIGPADAPVDIAAGAAVSFTITLSPSTDFDAGELELNFDCENSDSAAIAPGLNTVLLSASSSPVADIVALAATASGDGILSVTGSPASGAFSVASVNLGASGVITVDAKSLLPSNANNFATVIVCETDPVSGACINPAVPQAVVTTSIDAGETPTFAVFASIVGDVPFDPATNRIKVEFKDASGEVRGATSVAVRGATSSLTYR